MPPGAIYVGRPTIWGNPWDVAGAIEAGYRNDKAAAAALCVDLFREWLTGSEASMTRMLKDGEARRSALLARLGELRGRDLACWCRTERPCHADVLLELANR